MEAPHIGFINLFYNTVVRHELFIIMARGAGLGDVLLIGRCIVFQHADNAMWILGWAVTVHTGSYIRVAFSQLFSVNTALV